MTAIDEKEIARLRGTRGGWATQDKDALLDEVERLRGEHSVMVIQAKDARAQQRKAERERDEAREDLETESQWLTETHQMLEEARAQAAAMRAALNFPDGKETRVRAHGARHVAEGLKDNDVSIMLGMIDEALATNAGRDILDALAKAEAAIDEYIRADGSINRDGLRAALAAIQALGISKQRT